MSGLAALFDRARTADEIAARQGWLQSIDPRVKLVASAALIGSASLAHGFWSLAGLGMLAVGLGQASSVGIGHLARRVWLGVLGFSGLVALPAPFLVPGPQVAQLFGLAVTAPGLRVAGLLVGRAECAATLGYLLVATTPWPQVLAAMRALGVPPGMVAVLGMTQRYMFLLAQSAADMAEARRARPAGPATSAARRAIALASIGVLLARTLDLAEDVHLAMIARGYQGQVRRIHVFRTCATDWLVLVLALAVPLALLGLRA